MAAVQTIDVTTLEGSDNFPVNINDVYGLIETIASQNIRALRSTNRIVDGFFDYDVENGKVIEEAVIAMAKAHSIRTTFHLLPKIPKYMFDTSITSIPYSLRRLYVATTFEQFLQIRA